VACSLAVLIYHIKSLTQIQNIFKNGCKSISQISNRHFFSSNPRRFWVKSQTKCKIFKESEFVDSSSTQKAEIDSDI